METHAAPRVSVVIPTYNRAHLIERAVRSVLAQTYQDFEIIIVNDASSDSTGEVVGAIDDPRILYLRHERNRGGSAARNTGIKAAQGELIAFLDSDDEWLPGKLEKQIALLTAAPKSLGAVYTGLMASSAGSPGKRACPRKKGDLRKALAKRNVVGTTSSVVVRRECFAQVGYFDEALPAAQDYDMWIRISDRYQFEVVSEPLVRVHTEGGDRITGNIQAKEEALTRLSEKHRSEVTRYRYRRRRAWYLALLGYAWLLKGDRGRGRRMLRESLLLWPLSLRAWLYFLTLLLPATAYARIRKAIGRPVEK